MDILEKNVGPVAVSAKIASGKLELSLVDAALGASDVLSVDALVIVKALVAAVDAKFPSAKPLIDVVANLLEESVKAL